MAAGHEIVLWVLLGVALLSDLRYGLIPNRLTIPFIATGLVIQFTFQGTAGLSVSGLSIGTAFVLFFPLFALNVLAAGDVKLLMAAGAWLDPASTVRMAIISVVLGGVVGGVMLLVERVIPTPYFQTIALPRRAGKARMPFAPALFCAYLSLIIGAHYKWF